MYIFVLHTASRIDISSLCLESKQLKADEILPPAGLTVFVTKTFVLQHNALWSNCSFGLLEEYKSCQMIYPRQRQCQIGKYSAVDNYIVYTAYILEI